MFSLFPLLCYYFPPFSPRSLENLACVWKFSPLGCLPATERKKKKIENRISRPLLLFLCCCVYSCFVIFSMMLRHYDCVGSHCLSLALVEMLVLVAHVQLLFLLLLELFILRYFAPYGEQVAGAAASVFVPPSFGAKIV
jgi:hypothetical protein